MNFKSAYIRENFTEFLDAFLPDSTELSVDGIAFVRNQTSKITKITKLGECADLNLNLLEVLHNSNSDARVTLSREIFKVMRDNGWQNALVAFVPNDNPSVWRLSLVRMSYKLTDNGDLDFENSNPRRYSFLLGENQHTKTPEQYLAKRIHTLQELENCFSVETLTKEFYTELFTWYQWAQSTEIDIHYPNNACDKNDDRDDLPTHIIRLITRLMFVWFIKQKKFIPNELFQENVLQNDILNNFDPTSYTSGNYYNAILQNLFFASLNKKISERKFATGDREYGIKTLFRDNKKQTWFKIPHDAVIDLFKPVPFLNGGLFECLDQPIETCDENCKDPKIKIMYRDGFSRDDMRQKRAFIPNAVFFAPEHDVILSGDAKNKTVSGIINIFKKYNFTVEENTPNDIDVALDPELLGKVFENLLAAYNPETGESARKSSGSFYTPREIVNYMVEQSINAYLEQTVGENFKDKPDETKAALFNIKIIDPACGSGAFPMGILNNIFARLCAINPDFEQNPYETKLRLIENCIYGVDIQPIAVQISKLRFFISLICEQCEQNLNSDENYGIEQLPNLETKFVAANTLVSIQKPRERSFGDKYIEEIQTKLTNVRHQHFHAKTWQEKKNCRDRDRDLRNELLRALESNGMMETPELHKQAVNIAAWDPYNQNNTANFFDPKWMFGISDGFDIVIGNPPYVSNKKTDSIYVNLFGFSDDLYNYFFIKGMQLCKSYTGILSFITSNTFLTLESKHNIRDLLQSNRLITLNDLGAGVFLGAVVNTVISIVQRHDSKKINYNMKYIDSRNNFYAPKCYECPINTFRNSINSVFFAPSEQNMKIYSTYGEKLKALYEKYWAMISTSKNISKNLSVIEEYRKNLKPGDVSLLGLLTDGGQGLATANNGKYVAVMDGTKFADNIRLSRPKKLKEAHKKYNISELDGIQDFTSYLEDMSEECISRLFDKLKEKYGRDIFGQGYLFRIITSTDVANPDNLTKDEKDNGIDENKPHYVVYDKGDKDGNRWYIESPYYISWSKENVHFLKTNSGKKGNGMPVVRNSQFYFNEGFCWSDISDTRIRTRIKNNGIYDVKSMSLFSELKQIPDSYFICLLNSSFVGNYIKDFLNNTVSFQINDARKIPIIMPSDDQLCVFERIFSDCVNIQKLKFKNTITDTEAEFLLQDKHKILDQEVLKLYHLL